MPTEVRTAAGDGEISAPRYGARGVVSYVVTKGDRQRVVKLADAADPYALVAEIDRIDWIAGRLPVPLVVVSVPLPTGGHAAVFDMALGTDASQPEHRVDPWFTAELLGRTLRRVHDLPVDDCPFTTRLDVRLRAIQRRIVADAYDPSLFTAPYRRYGPGELFERLQEQRPDDEDLVFTHGAFRPEAVTMSPGSVTSIVDWCNAGVADRYIDLSLLLATVADVLTPEVTPRLLEGYGVGSPDLVKLDYYALLGQFS